MFSSCRRVQQVPIAEAPPSRPLASGGDSAPFERPEKGGAIELRSANAAHRARFRQLARHLRSPAPVHDKLGLSVGGDDRLLSFEVLLSLVRRQAGFRLQATQGFAR